VLASLLYFSGANLNFPSYKSAVAAVGSTSAKLKDCELRVLQIGMQTIGIFGMPSAALIGHNVQVDGHLQLCRLQDTCVSDAAAALQMLLCQMLGSDGDYCAAASLGTRYRVRRGKTPGTFYYSVLDNGVTSNE